MEREADPVAPRDETPPRRDQTPPRRDKWARWRLFHEAFEVGIGLKGLDGVLELIGGVLLLAVDPAHLSSLIQQLTQHELSEDPHDFIARVLVRFASGFTTEQQLFGALYLLSHGVVKIGLVAALWRRRLWAYPTAITIFGLFAVYQMYRFNYTHSWFLIPLTLLDAFVIWLTWVEYRRVRGDQVSAGSHG